MSDADEPFLLGAFRGNTIESGKDHECNDTDGTLDWVFLARVGHNDM